MSEIEGTAAGRGNRQQESVERSFETPSGVSLRVENACGEVKIETHDVPRTEVTVVSLHPEADDLVRAARISERPSAHGQEIVVEIPRARALARFWLSDRAAVGVLVKLPKDSELDVSTASAPVTARGRYRAASIATASGEIAIEEITGPARLRTASGVLDVGAVGEASDVKSASGDITIGATGGGKVCTASGDIDLGRVERPTRIRAASGDVRLGEALQGADIETVSGDQRIERAAAGDYTLRAVSGDIVVAVVPRSLVRFDAGSMSGHVASDIDIEQSRPVVAGEPGDVPELFIQAKTVSGDISVARAAS